MLSFDKALIKMHDRQRFKKTGNKKQRRRSFRISISDRKIKNLSKDQNQSAPIFFDYEEKRMVSHKIMLSFCGSTSLDSCNNSRIYCFCSLFVHLYARWGKSPSSVSDSSNLSCHLPLKYSTFANMTSVKAGT